MKHTSLLDRLQIHQTEDVNLNQLKGKKRPLKDGTADNSSPTKRIRVNGANSELDISDNSNSSFKDLVGLKHDHKRDVVIVNSDSNSSFLDVKNDPVLEQQQPKKRGRKKGSRNHRSLLVEAETSFSNKMAVSRGNAKVKTTQELVASLQNKSAGASILGTPTTVVKSKEDLRERAAKLTERVSIIDQKLNTSGGNRFKSSLQKKGGKVIESGSYTKKSAPSDNKSANSSHTDEEIIIVDEEPEKLSPETVEEKQPEVEQQVAKSLSVEEALARLPPILPVNDDDEDGIYCSCVLKEHKSDFSMEEDAEIPEHKFEFVVDDECPATEHLGRKYHLGEVAEDRVLELHGCFLPGVNGNCSLGRAKEGPQISSNGLYVNVVPNRNTECIPKCSSDAFTTENFQKYNISNRTENSLDSGNCSGKLEEETGGVGGTVAWGRDGGAPCGDRMNTFREWHEMVEMPSYNEEVLRILPYVIIDWITN